MPISIGNVKGESIKRTPITAGLSTWLLRGKDGTSNLRKIKLKM